MTSFGAILFLCRGDVARVLAWWRVVAGKEASGATLRSLHYAVQTQTDGGAVGGGAVGGGWWRTESRSGGRWWRGGRGITRCESAVSCFCLRANARRQNKDFADSQVVASADKS